MTKVKVLLRVKDAKGNVRCEVKQNADTGLLRIVGEIDWWKNSSDDFRVALDTMKQSGITKLKAYINSPGGSVWEANEIYNLIVAFCPEEDRSVDIGAMCASAATTIALAFPQKNTRVFQNVTWMMHNCQIGVYGEKKDLISFAKLLENLENTYRKSWAKRMSVSETFLKNKMDETWWLTAEELIKYNIASSVINENDQVPTDARQVFNKLEIKDLPAVLNKALPPAEEKPTEPQNLETKMKNFILLFLASTSGALNSFFPKKEESTEAEMVAGLTKAFADKEAKITELTNSVTAKDTEITNLKNTVKKHNDDMIKALLDVAQNVEKKITAETRKIYEEQAPVLGYDGLSKILNAIPARTSVKNQINNPAPDNKGGEKEEEREEPTFSEGPGGSRVYNGAGDQKTVLHRMMVEQSKAKK